MKKSKIALLVAVPLLAVAAIAAAAVAGRSDCPGTKICPVTGEVVCIDQCPENCGAPCRADAR